MNNAERIEIVSQAIKENRDFSLIEKLEFIKSVKSEKEYRNYVVILLVLIEASRFYDSATSILIKKVYKENIYPNPQITSANSRIGEVLIETIRENAIFPYCNLSSGIRRLISVVVSSKGDPEESERIKAITSSESLTRLNEFFLQKYIEHTGIDNTAMQLFYNCVIQIDSNTHSTHLSSNAASQILTSIKDGGQLQNYLKLFIRPFFSNQSPAYSNSENYAPEPYYSQIFGNSTYFLEVLNSADQSNWNDEERKRLVEVRAFANVYNENFKAGRNYVDITQGVTITRTLHENVSQ